jgi:hypothetical protein
MYKVLIVVRTRDTCPHNIRTEIVSFESIESAKEAVDNAMELTDAEIKVHAKLLNRNE